MLNFDAAVGHLIFEPNKGLEAMFTLMNTARIGTDAFPDADGQRGLRVFLMRPRGHDMNILKQLDSEARPLVVALVLAIAVSAALFLNHLLDIGWHR